MSTRTSRPVGTTAQDPPSGLEAPKGMRRGPSLVLMLVVLALILGATVLLIAL